MLSVTDLTVSFGKKILYQDVNLKFNSDGCYGLIGANGAGKSTFLKVLSGEIEPTKGEVHTGRGERISHLEQNHFAHDEKMCMEAVFFGEKQLYNIRAQREALYAKDDLSDEDGMKVADLEAEYASLGGYDAETEAERLLSGLGVAKGLWTKKLGELDDVVKMRVLLAQSIFGNPQVLLLDEPTNHLDLDSISWLEGFLEGFHNTVIVASHDRYFLNRICTSMIDVDFQTIKIYPGNYAFWKEMREFTMQQRKDQARRSEEKAAELRSFIARFSSNAARSRQATSRKKELDKLTLDALPQTSRRYPFIAFESRRSLGSSILHIKDLKYTNSEGQTLMSRLTLDIERGEKVAIIGSDRAARQAFLELLAGNLSPDTGQIKWGETVSKCFTPRNNTPYFTKDDTMIDWLFQWTNSDDIGYIRSVLGKMLFSGEEGLKKVPVLSGGEKVRCMICRAMLLEANFYIFDEPTAQLDLETITSLNTGLEKFNGCEIVLSHDRELLQTVCNRVLEFTSDGVIDRKMRLEDYLESPAVTELRDKMGGGEHQRVEI